MRVTHYPLADARSKTLYRSLYLCITRPTHDFHGPPSSRRCFHSGSLSDCFFTCISRALKGSGSCQPLVCRDFTARVSYADPHAVFGVYAPLKTPAPAMTVPTPAPVTPGSDSTTSSTTTVSITASQSSSDGTGTFREWTHQARVIGLALEKRTRNPIHQGGSKRGKHVYLLFSGRSIPFPRHAADGFGSRDEKGTHKRTLTEAICTHDNEPKLTLICVDHARPTRWGSASRFIPMCASCIR